MFGFIKGEDLMSSSFLCGLLVRISLAAGNGLCQPSDQEFVDEKRYKI